MKSQLNTLVLLILFSLSGFAQSTTLDNYVTEALSSNLALQQKQLSYEKSLAALREAKAMYLPKLAIEARYSVARGGRTFEIPVGDLMNPVYQNLNLINSLNRQNPDYPTIPEYTKIENQSTNFLRETEQESRVRLLMPVYNAAIQYNQRIKANSSQMEKISVEVYRKELTKEVKTAYFNYLKANEAKRLFDNTKKLVEENLRTTESLYKNHKVTIDVVYAAEAEVQVIEQQLAVAVKDQQMAQAYFNFLLNRDYNAEIMIDAAAEMPVQALSIDAARQRAGQNRQELQQLQHYLSLSDNQIKLHKSNYQPQLNLVADYGIQGTSFNVDADADYFLGSVLLSWNIFDRPNKAKIQQAKIDRQVIQQQISETRQQIGLEVINAYYGLEAARQQVTAAEKELKSSNKAYQLVNKKFVQGQANLVEWTDALTQVTNAEQKLNIARFDYQIQQVQLERAIN